MEKRYPTPVGFHQHAVDCVRRFIEIDGEKYASYHAHGYARYLSVSVKELLDEAKRGMEGQMKFRLHYHQNGREKTSDHPSMEDAILFAVAREMAEDLSVDFLADANGNVVLDEDALNEAVWGWGLDHA